MCDLGRMEVILGMPIRATGHKTWDSRKILREQDCKNQG